MTRKRLLLSLLAVTLCLLAVPAGLLAWTVAGNPEMQDGQVLPDAVLIQDGYVASFLLDLGGSRVALVDAGNDPDGAAILAALERRKLPPEAVTAILITHGHPDHVAACAKFPGATVYAGAPELPAMRGEVAYQGPLPRLFGSAPAPCADVQPVEDGQQIPLGGKSATAFLVPGHSRGSVAWLYSGVLYLGDSADATKEGEMVGAKWLFSDDTALNAASLKQLSERLHGQPIHTLAFSHTGTLPGGDALQRFGLKQLPD